MPKPPSIKNSWAEPWKIKSIEHISLLSPEQRQQAIERAGWNTFLLHSSEVYIDLLTDSGTSAMSDRQWSALMSGDEAYAGSKDYFELERTVKDVYGYQEFIPTHQGRAAEHILSQILVKDSSIVPGNMYFTTTRFHQEYAGGIFEDIITEQAHDPDSDFAFKGNVSIDRLSELVDKNGANNIAYISLEANVNMAGGQPFSMENLENLHEFCSKHDILIMLDATRLIENAYFIKTREKGYENESIPIIVKKICSLSDGCTVSAKKDGLVNIGGFLALRDPVLAEKARNMLVAFEGLHTYGGMAGRDMAALAVGIKESLSHDYIRARVEQVAYLGSQLQRYEVPIVVPYGGHAIYINAKKILNHIPQEQFPAQRLAAELYLEGGIRAMERGIVSAGRDSSGSNHHPELELVRLTIPRRVYTQSHLDVVAESTARVAQRATQLRGLELVFEPENLRFFRARFRPIA